MTYIRVMLYVTLASGPVAGGWIGALMVGIAAAALVITERKP